jgi:hypothetical protein
MDVGAFRKQLGHGELRCFFAKGIAHAGEPGRLQPVVGKMGRPSYWTESSSLSAERGSRSNLKPVNCAASGPTFFASAST